MSRYKIYYFINKHIKENYAEGDEDTTGENELSESLGK